MKEINFVTHNEHKVSEFQRILGEDVKVNQIDFDYSELRSDNPEDIVIEAVKKLADEYNKPIVVEDSGIFISALGDFPGTCSAYVHKRIGLKGILKLMEGIENRECFYRSAVGYCEPGLEPISFLGEEKGMISEEIKGEYGFGHDPIFIAKGEEKTYAEMEDVTLRKKFRKMAVLKLKEYLNNK